MALSWLAATEGHEAAARQGAGLDDRWAAVLSLVEAGASPVTTSAGRLIDAVAALLGVRRRITYEGQAAIELEAAAAGVPDEAAPAYADCELISGEGQAAVLDPGPLIGALLADRERGTPVAVVAAGFHRALARASSLLAIDLARSAHVSTVALSGGVFQNVRLTRLVSAQLSEAGLEVLVHERLPPNDGGISVGQAAIAALSREAGEAPVVQRPGRRGGAAETPGC
jgi:hydrogenase maturation protein HypF